MNENIKSGKPEGLGTWGGVFTPSILTILGIILFLRHGWVVGSVGLWATLAMIAIAHSVAIFTSLSLAAIATNRPIKGGGDYYLVSRSLGPEVGGSLGLVLYLAQSISIGFYCFGFGEATSALLHDYPLATPGRMALIAAALLFVIAWLGSDLATRFQFVIMAIVAAALVSFCFGASERADGSILLQNLAMPADSPGFWIVFAIFFPAVTGFTQGVSMSGDLAKPRKSLPTGTFAAIGLSLIVYTATAMLFAAGAPLSELRAGYEAFRDFSHWGPLFDAGVIAATLSSALASFLGGPRILQALSRDNIFPFLAPFKKGSGASDNPRPAVALSAGIAFIVLLLGDLNAIASLISMFFLISYGLLNWSTYVAARGASPTFRPRFRYFDARLAFLGSMICLGAMMAIDAFYGVLAILLVGGVYQYLLRQEIAADWSDSRSAYNYRKLKTTIKEISRFPVTEWNWQPNLVIFAGNEERRLLLARLGTLFAGVSGFATSVGIVQDEEDVSSVRDKHRQLEASMHKELSEGDLEVFSLAVIAPDLTIAIRTLLQTWGIGPIKVNTVMVDWWSNIEGAEEANYTRQVMGVIEQGCHVLILDAEEQEFEALKTVEPQDRRIDVWWWEVSSCRLSLLFAYLLTRSENWEECTIRLLVPCVQSRQDDIEAEIRQMLEEARIDGEVCMVNDPNAAKIVDYSADASLVLFRINSTSEKFLDPFGGDLNDLLPQLPITGMVWAANRIELNEP